MKLLIGLFILGMFLTNEKANALGFSARKLTAYCNVIVIRGNNLLDPNKDGAYHDYDLDLGFFNSPRTLYRIDELVTSVYGTCAQKAKDTVDQYCQYGTNYGKYFKALANIPYYDTSIPDYRTSIAAAMFGYGAGGAPLLGYKMVGKLSVNSPVYSGKCGGNMTFSPNPVVNSNDGDNYNWIP